MINGKRFDGIVHRITWRDSRRVRAACARDAPAYSPHHALRPALLRLESADSLSDRSTNSFCAATRELTGFERVMIYRFDERGHGSVDAE